MHEESPNSIGLQSVTASSLVHLFCFLYSPTVYKHPDYLCLIEFADIRGRDKYSALTYHLLRRRHGTIQRAQTSWTQCCLSALCHAEVQVVASSATCDQKGWLRSLEWTEVEAQGATNITMHSLCDCLRIVLEESLSSVYCMGTTMTAGRVWRRWHSRMKGDFDKVYKHVAFVLESTVERAFELVLSV